MPTPHIEAQPGEFATTVLMPGDPLRAKWIAGTYLDNVKLVTAVRNMYGYTGLYKGRRLSVMAHGMGIPSCSIYATELIEHYQVNTLIRVGSCGAVAPALKLGDVLLALGASTDSKANRQRFMDNDFAAVADYRMLQTAVQTAETLAQPVIIGNVFSTDLFYSSQTELLTVLARMGIQAVEMELAGLYAVAAERQARALGLLTVSDIIPTGQATTPAERESGFQAMVEIALETAYNLDETK